MKFELIKKRVPENPQLQEVIKKYKDEYNEVLRDLVANSEDMMTLERMALEAALGSPEMQEAWKQVLIERHEKRKTTQDDSLHDLVVDEEGKLVHRTHVLSGEKQ